MENVFRPATQIVESVMLDSVGDFPLAGLPKPTHLARRANRARQKNRPEDPKDLGFVVSQQFLPEGNLRLTMYSEKKVFVLFYHLFKTPNLLTHHCKNCV